MTDIELLPLPPLYIAPSVEPVDYPNVAQALMDYARANVAHSTAPLQAEVEALRELCGMAYQLAGVHDAPEKWLDALSNAAAGRPFSTDGLLPYMPQAVCDAEAEAKALRAEVGELHMSAKRRDQYVAEKAAQAADAIARAERLAEALLELCNVIDGHEVPVAVEGKAAHARDALRDHDQEVSNG